MGGNVDICLRSGLNRGKFGKSVANFVVSFQEWKHKHSQRPPRAFHVKRNVNSELVSCFVSTLSVMGNSPQKVGVSFLHDFPVSTLALAPDLSRQIGLQRVIFVP